MFRHDALVLRLAFTKELPCVAVLLRMIIGEFQSAIEFSSMQGSLP